MRAPMMPNGTAHTAMSSDAHGATPRRRSRYSMISTAATMPRTMHNAYARIGRPSTCHTEVVGLGIAARFTAHTLPGHGAASGAGTHALGKFRAQRPQPALALGRVVRLEHAADQRAAHDHP